MPDKILVSRHHWDKRCRNCEFWDAGGEKAAETAAIGECLSVQSPYFQSKRDDFCPAFSPDTTRFEVA